VISLFTGDGSEFKSNLLNTGGYDGDFLEGLIEIGFPLA